MNRLFFSLYPEAEIASQILTRCQAFLPTGRAVAKAQLHLTLAFLGNVPDAQLATIKARAGGISLSSFELVLDHFGFFAKSKTFYLQAQYPPTPLKQLAQQLSPYPSHNFVPHISLVRGVTRPPSKTLLKAKIAPIRWPVTRFYLIESGENARPGRYRALACWPLEN